MPQRRKSQIINLHPGYVSVVPAVFTYASNPATQVMDGTPPPPTTSTGLVTYQGMTLEQLSAYYQWQPDYSGCGPTTIAMGTNIINSNPKGIEVINPGDGKKSGLESYLEQQGLKVSGVGMPNRIPFTTDAIEELNPNSKVVEATGASIGDLKQSLKEGKVVIVTFSWQTNQEIVDAYQNSKPTPIGHYMILVGYDDKNFYFLDPGYETSPNRTPTTGISSYTYSELEDYWKTKSNFGIQSETMYTISKKEPTAVRTGAGVAIGNAIKKIDIFEGNTIAAIGNAIGDGATSIASMEASGTIAVGKAIGGSIEAVAAALANLRTDVGKVLGNGIESAANSVADFIMGLGTLTNNASVVTGANDAANAIKTEGTAISNSIKASATKGAEKIKNNATAISNNIKSFSNATANFTTNVGATISNGVKKTANIAAVATKVAGNLAGDVATNAVHTVTSIAKSVAKAVTNTVKTAANTVTSAVKSVANTVTNTAKSVANSITNIFKSPAQTTQKTSNSVTNRLKR